MAIHEKKLIQRVIHDCTNEKLPSKIIISNQYSTKKDFKVEILATMKQLLFSENSIILDTHFQMKIYFHAIMKHN